jgi:hypothetical protein
MRAEEEQLARIRKRRLWALALVLCMPLLWLVPSEWGADKMALPWLVAVSVATSLVSFSRCPQCQRFYHRPWSGGFQSTDAALKAVACRFELRAWNQN